MRVPMAVSSHGLGVATKQASVPRLWPRGLCIRGLHGSSLPSGAPSLVEEGWGKGRLMS